MLDVYVCPLCGRVFKDEKRLYRHIVTKHSHVQLVISSSILVKYLMKIEQNTRYLRLLTEINERINELSERLTNVEMYIRDPGLMRSEIKETTVFPIHSRSVDVPTFVRNNPWISVLRRRGRS